MKNSEVFKTNLIVSALVLSVYLFSGGGGMSFANDAANVIVLGLKQEFHSEILSDHRTLRIFLPESYEHSGKSYPVIYVLDGEFLFEPTVATTKTRSGRDLMPESIVVGIDNSSNDQRFGMGMPMRRSPNGSVSFEEGRPGEFLAFLKNELMPDIERDYRTAPHRTLIGMSPTNGPVITGYLDQTGLFHAWLAFSADVHFYLPDNSLIANRLVETAIAQSDRRGWFYISRGAHDLPHNSPELPDAFSKLEKGFAPLNGRFAAKAEIIPDGEHYASALDSLISAFAFIYPETVWRPDYRALRSSEKPTEELRAFYENLSKDYGFKAYPAIDGYWMGNSVAGFGRRLMSQERFDEAAKLYSWALEYYPNSSYLHHLLSMASEHAGRPVEGSEAANKAFMRSTDI